MRKLAPYLIIGIFVSCTSGSPERPSSWQGNWKAEWSTDPANYPEVKDMEFYMTGAFNITSDSLTVTANGYPGCIFNIDTLSHTQSWKVANDTLFLMNEETAGMTYRVVATYEDRIELQLMEDIFVTLSK